MNPWLWLLWAIAAGVIAFVGAAMFAVVRDQIRRPAPVTEADASTTSSSACVVVTFGDGLELRCHKASTPGHRGPCTFTVPTASSRDAWPG